MTTVTGLQLSEYLKLDPLSPYTLLFQRIYEVTKPKAIEDIEDGEIEEVEEEEENKDDSVIVEDEISEDDNKENCRAVETRKKFSKDILHWTPESNHQNQNVPAAKLAQPRPPPPMFAHLPPPLGLPPLPLSLAATTQFNPSLFTAPLPSVSAAPTFPFSFPPLALGFPGPGLPNFNLSRNPFLVAPVSSRESLLPHPPQQLGGLQPMYTEAPDEVEFREAKGFDIRVMIDLDPNPERMAWLVKYMDFMLRMGKPLTQCPSMYKVNCSLYK